MSSTSRYKGILGGFCTAPVAPQVGTETGNNAVVGCDACDNWARLNEAAAIAAHHFAQVELDRTLSAITRGDKVFKTTHVPKEHKPSRFTRAE